MEVVPAQQEHEANQLLPSSGNPNSSPRTLTEILMKKSAELIEFLLPFECLLTVFKSIQNLRRSFDDDLEKTYELLNSIKQFLSRKFDYYTRLIEEGRRELEAIAKYENSEESRREMELKRREILFEILNRKNVRKNLEIIREVEKSKAEKKREGIKKTDGSQRVLVHIKALIEINNGELQTVVSTYDSLKVRLSPIEDFLLSTENKGNLLRVEALDSEIVVGHFSEIIEIFKDFSDNYGRLANIRYELEYHNRSVTIQEELARLVDAIYVDQIVEQYINAELSFIKSKIDSKKLKFISKDNVDKSERLTKCVRKAFECNTNLERSLNSFTFNGGLYCSSSNTTLYHNCQTNNYSVSVTEVHSVTNDFSLNGQIVRSNTKNPKVYRQSDLTIRLRQEMEDLIREYNRVEALKSYMNEIKVEIERKNLEYKEVLDWSNKSILDKKKHLSIYADHYEKFITFAKQRDFSIRPEILNAVIGVYLNHASLKLKPGCCNCCSTDVPSLAVDIEASKIFKVFLSILINKGKVHLKSCCADPVLKQLHHCKSIHFNDFVCFLLSTHVAGTLKNSRNLRQLVANGIRSDDIIDSFHGCIRGAATVITLGEQHRILFDDPEALAKIHTFEQIAEQSFTKSHYVSFVKEFRHFNLEKTK